MYLNEQMTTAPDSPIVKPLQIFIPQPEITSLGTPDMSATPFTITQNPLIPEYPFLSPYKMDYIPPSIMKGSPVKPELRKTKPHSVVNFTNNNSTPQLCRYELIFSLGIILFTMFVMVPLIIVIVICLSY